MAWIESHEEIADHKKTGWLSQHLECNVPTAVGYLHLLWHYTLKVAWRDGDLSDFIPPAIERACWWTGKSGALVDAFQKSGYMDGMKVHDWQEYAKHIIYQRLYNETRRKESKPFPTKKPNSSFTAVTTVATVPNQTLPNQKKESPRAAPIRFSKPTAQEVAAYGREIGFQTINGSDFVDYYESKGWKVGSTPMKDWKATVRRWHSKHKELSAASPAPINRSVKYVESIPSPDEIMSDTDFQKLKRSLNGERASL